MEFERLISERYSVRSFKGEHLPQDVIDKIISAFVYTFKNGMRYRLSMNFLYASINSSKCDLLINAFSPFTNVTQLSLISEI